MEVKFSINDRTFTVNPSTVPIDTTLNTFIRNYARLTGTKFMCLEGGCGVCIINITGLQTASNQPRSIAVNSCLWLVYSCHGLHVTTIEGLGSREYGYHPIQQALYEYNGSQCGYCSPAMVMNMYSLLEQNNGKVTMKQVENSFGGNICRCTGYRPILDAFKSLTVDSSIGDIEDAASTSCCRSKKDKHYRHISITCSTNAVAAPITGELNHTLHLTFCDSRVWHRVMNLQQLLDTLRSVNDDYILVSGNTAHGVYRRSNNIKHFIDVNLVSELHKVSSRKSKLTIGANVSLTETMNILESVAADKSDFAYLMELVKHIDLVATIPIRNTGTIAGNLSIKHEHNEFPSDIFLLLETIGAELNIVSIDGSIHLCSPKEYLSIDMRHKVILNVNLPKLPASKFKFRSYKIMPRAQNAHAMLNAAFLFELETTDAKSAVKSCRICYGGVNPQFIHAEETEQYLTGVDDLYSNQIIQGAIACLRNDIHPDAVLPDPVPEYRQRLAIALFYRFCLNTIPFKDRVRLEFRSGAAAIERSISSGRQLFDTNRNLWPLTQPVLKNEALVQCSGEAQYSNDLFSHQSVGDELWCAFVQTTEFHEKIIKIDPSKALKIPGVHSFFSAKDIPGKNSFTRGNLPGMVEDEVIFIDIGAMIQYYGQPCGMIVANSMSLANYAATLVKITYKKVRGKEPLVFGQLLSVIDKLRDQENNEFLTEQSENNERENLNAGGYLSGEFEVGTQYHYPMEPQTTFCIPSDDGGINVYAASQWFDLIQYAISVSLKMPHNKINIVIRRVGGAYGSKIARSALVASACALACYLLNRPIRFVMTIEAMMSICGKRYPCANKYQLFADSTTGKIRRLNNFYVQDYGYSLNETNDDIVLQTFLLSYVSNGWNYSGKKLTTPMNISNWCRAPGSTESIAMIETIIEHIAHKFNLEPVHVRLNNLPDKDVWKSMLQNILKDIEYFQRKKEIDTFNEQNRWHKRGIAFIQMKYPIGYIGSFSSYVAIYHGDGTVIISHGGVDFGQGLNTKAAQIAAFALNIPLEMVQVKATNNQCGANSIYSAATVASDSVCLATKRACEILLKRIKPIRDRMPDNTSWQEIVETCYQNFVDLTARYTFIPSDSKQYFVYGCACGEIEWDSLTGNLQIKRIDLIEDTGRSMSPLIDVGQVEGAFIMGIGYWLTEKYIYDRQTGQLVTNRTWNYKTPGAKDIPIDFRVKFIETENTNNRVGVLRSKTTGEPSLSLAYVVVCALRHALHSVLKDNGQHHTFLPLGSGLTPDILSLAAPANIDDFLID